MHHQRICQLLTIGDAGGRGLCFLELLGVPQVLCNSDTPG